MPNKVRNGIELLSAAVRCGDKEKVRWLLTKLEDSSTLAGRLVRTSVVAGNESLAKLVNVMDSEMNSPLYYAARWGSVPVIKRLLELGADVDAANCDLRTPLHRAVLLQKETIVNLLLDRGAQVNVLNKTKNSPLHYAVRWGSVPVIERLLELGADLNAANGNLQTPLHRAVCLKKEIIVNLLLDRGAQVNVMDRRKNRPLHYAARWGSVPVIERLLELRAEIDPINSNNLTPLLIAAKEMSGEAVNALLRHGADTKAKRIDGSTALHYVVEWADESVVENLIYYGADPKACDSRNCLPLDYSIEYRRPKVTRILLENYGYVSDMFRFLIHKIREGGETSEILRLHLLDLEVRNLWPQANDRNGIFHCRSFFKDIIKGSIDGEIKKMKRRCLVEEITLYDVITKSKNQMLSLVRNTSLLEALASVNIAEDFPIFGGLFKYKWEAALSRRRLILGGVSALRSLIITSVAFRINVSDVMEDILSMLTDADLRNMITAAQLTN